MMKRKEQLKEEFRQHKNELKEKQLILRKQEKVMKDQHEANVKLEEKCRKLQTMINEKKAGVLTNDQEATKTEEDVIKLRNEYKETEKEYNNEKRKYKELIAGQETRIKDLNYELEKLQLELKQKDQESRINSLKINELKRQLRTNAKTGGQNNQAETQSKAPKSEVNENLIAMNVEQLKRDMQAEISHKETKKASRECSPSLEGDIELVPSRPEEKNVDDEKIIISDKLLMESKNKPISENSKISPTKMSTPIPTNPIEEKQPENQKHARYFCIFFTTKKRIFKAKIRIYKKETKNIIF